MMLQRWPPPGGLFVFAVSVLHLPVAAAFGYFTFISNANMERGLT